MENEALIASMGIFCITALDLLLFIIKKVITVDFVELNKLARDK